MNGRTGSPLRWLLLAALALIATASVLIPMYLIRPFVPQSPSGLTLAFLVRRWAPLLTLLTAAGGVLLTWRIWSATRRVFPRAATLLLSAWLLGAAWMARQDYFEWMFAPLPDARFERLPSADFVEPQDVVLAIRIDGDAVAYPVRQLAYHHLVNDEVGRVPIVATY